VYRKPGARSSLDVFGSSSRRPMQSSQRRSVDGDFEVYDDEEKGEFRGRQSLYQESSISEEITRHWRSPRHSVLTDTGTDSLKEGLLMVGGGGGMESGDSRSDTEDGRSNDRSDDDSSDGDEKHNVELELDVDEILSSDEHADAIDNTTTSLSNTILSHISPSKKVLSFK